MVKSYPSLVTAEWLKKYMTELHFGGVHPDELEDMDTDWDNPVFVSGSFKLVRVPLSKLINTVPGGTDEMLAEDYAELKTAFPPIVLDSSYNILDGNHRAMAAEFRGDKDIQAYMPVLDTKTASITISLGEISFPHTKVAISVPELVSQTNAFSVKRRPGCTPTLLNSNPKQLFLNYNVKCKESYSDPAGHDVRVQFDVTKVEETQNANDLDVQLNCSCPAFLYWGAQWNLHGKDGLLGTPRPELKAPTQRLDLRSNFVICKHCKAVLERILPSVQHNIIKIIREKTVEKNKELEKHKKPERLEKREEEMRKRIELKKLRETKNKSIQKKLLDALRKREEAEALKLNPEEEAPEVVGRDEPAVDLKKKVPVFKTPKTEDVTLEEPEGDKDVIGLLENEENKLLQKEHEKIKNKPHLHKGLPYEVEEEKEEHGHDVPSDKDLVKTLKKRKRTSLELALLDSVAGGD